MIAGLKRLLDRMRGTPAGDAVARIKILQDERTTDQLACGLYHQLADIPQPETFLGEGYGDPILWKHQDDLFVDFQILKHIVVDDVAFFMRYLNHELKEDEKQVYPYFYSPCFAEVKDVVSAEMSGHPLLEISEEQSCYIVMFQNVMGLLLFSKTDVEDISKRSYGFEEIPEKQYYQMTFMRFDKNAVERLDFAGTVIEHYHHSKNHSNPIRVNFAQYNNDE